jgi:hypothetical protein
MDKTIREISKRHSHIFRDTSKKIREYDRKNRKRTKIINYFPITFILNE